MTSPDTAVAPIVYIGIDVGGTKVRAIAAGADGLPVSVFSEPTEPDLVPQLCRIVADMGGESLRAVGVGVPGAVDPISGLISQIPNIPLINGVALAPLLSARLGVPVRVENDLSAAALAEHDLGGHDAETLAVLAAGTGIGLGIVHAGSIVQGRGGAAGEIANLPLADGRELEDAVSISGLKSAYLVHGGSPEHEVRDIIRGAESGGIAQLAAVDEYARHLSTGVRIVTSVLDPGLIVLTGGIGSQQVMRDALHRHLDGSPAQERIRASELGDESPARGALQLALLAAR